MGAFMVLATFREGTDMADVMAVVDEEVAQVKRLEADGKLGGIHLALARGTVFIEAFADDAEGATAVVASLPMARWWDLDVYPLAAAPTAGAAS